MTLDLCEVCGRVLAEQRDGKVLTTGDLCWSPCARECYRLGYDRLARRGQASASGWKAGADVERERIAASFERSAQMLFEEGNEIGSAEHRGFAFAIRHMPLPEEPQSQAPAPPSADELAGALANLLHTIVIREEDAQITGPAMTSARALLARRRAP